MKRIRVSVLEFVFCDKENSLRLFDAECVNCEFFDGHYSAIGYIDCGYKDREDEGIGIED